MAHSVYSITLDAAAYKKLKARADKNERSIMREITLIMRGAPFTKAVKKNKTWVKALEACLNGKS